MQPPGATPFAGLSVLVVEDETMVAFLAEDMLKELGCESVWHAISVPRALQLLGEREPSLAILDVNLAGGTVYPVAKLLQEKNIPFVFATGYGRVPPPWNAHPVVAKPFKLDELETVLRTALEQRRKS